MQHRFMQMEKCIAENAYIVSNGSIDYYHCQIETKSFMQIYFNIHQYSLNCFTNTKFSNKCQYLTSLSKVVL